MKKTLFIIAAVFAAFTLASCTTAKELSEELTPAQLIQMGQNAFDSSDYNTAIRCYETVLDRFGTQSDIYIEAKYELAHVYLNQKKYDKAYKNYKEVLDMFDLPYAGSFPQAYKKLAKIGINQIPENKRPSNPSEEE